MRTGKRSDTGRLALGLLTFAARELAATLLVLIGASLLLFFILKAAPSDEHRALRLDLGASQTSAARVAEDKSIYDASYLGEYLSWLGNAAVGDFGVSTSIQRGRPGSDLIWPAAFDSFKLIIAGVFLSVCMALAVASWRVYRPASLSGKFAAAALSLFSAIPVFLYVYVGVASGNRLIAYGGMEGWWSLPSWFPLPMSQALAPWLFAALILAVGDGGLIDLFSRFSGELDHAATGEHLLGARLLGIPVPREIARGFLPDALSHIARRISFFLGSLVVLEATLGWAGLGYLAWRAAAERDMPVLLGSALVMATALRVLLMACDFIGYFADPRRRSAP